MESLPTSDPSEAVARRSRPPLAWMVMFVAAVLLIRPASVAFAQRPEVTENSIGMKFVRIPAGAFDMGLHGTSGGEDDEWIPGRSIHRVRITRSFLMGQTEVTQGQWERVMGTTPWKGRKNWQGRVVKDGPTVAVNYVDWDNAVEFCRKLTEIERQAGRLPGASVYRLPTEAEWEYACRAGTKTKWSFGDDESLLGGYAWFSGNADDPGEDDAHDVGKKKPNPWNLYDMHGNVKEWCSDWYDSKYYRKSPDTDPKGPESDCTARVVRGGSSHSVPSDCRSANRWYYAPKYPFSDTGFRVVCELQ